MVNPIISLNVRKYAALIPVFIFSFLFYSCSSGRYAAGNDDSGSRYNYRILKSSETIASYYADEFHGKKTASGEVYNMYDLTAAHVSYPLGTIVKVTNLQNNKSVVLKINDRKPGGNKRDIDLSYKAAMELDMIEDGIAKVRVDVLRWGNPAGK